MLHNKCTASAAADGDVVVGVVGGMPAAVVDRALLVGCAPAALLLLLLLQMSRVTRERDDAARQRDLALVERDTAQHQVGCNVGCICHLLCCCGWLNFAKLAWHSKHVCFAAKLPGLLCLWPLLLLKPAAAASFTHSPCSCML
jgi:hypothetical protein